MHINGYIHVRIAIRSSSHRNLIVTSFLPIPSATLSVSPVSSVAQPSMVVRPPPLSLKLIFNFVNVCGVQKADRGKAVVPDEERANVGAMDPSGSFGETGDGA